MPSLVRNHDDYDQDSTKTLTDADGEDSDDTTQENGEQRGDSKREQSKRHKPGGFCCHHDGLQTTNKLCTHKCGFLFVHTQHWSLNSLTITEVIRSRGRRKGAPNQELTAPKLQDNRTLLKDKTPDLAPTAVRHDPQETLVAVLRRTPFTFEEAKLHAVLHH